MASIEVKYYPYANALPPRPLRIANASWAGDPTVKMKDGSDPQPWHCLPYVEGSTYGLELIYPHETECRVRHVNGTIQFDWDFAREPGGHLTGLEFGVFSPVDEARFYLFNTRLDVQCAPGHVLRTEPHPRYFNDDTGTVPLPMIGHLQNEWYPRLLFVVFRAPRPGDCHIFRKGEPFAQILFVPQKVSYEITRMPAEEAGQRRKLEQAIGSLRQEIAENHWRTGDDGRQDNHYKVLVRAFAREGLAGVDKEIQEARDRHQQRVAACTSVDELLALGDQYIEQRQLEQAVDVFAQVLRQDPNNARALSNLGLCYCVGPLLPRGIELLRRATLLQPQVAQYHRNLGDVWRRVGRLAEAEACYRAALAQAPEDAVHHSALALALVQQGRTAEGFTAYQQAARLGLAAAKEHVTLGSAFAQRGCPALARTCYEGALARDPVCRAARRLLRELPAVDQGEPTGQNPAV